jgi:hypothetical protein
MRDRNQSARNGRWKWTAAATVASAAATASQGAIVQINLVNNNISTGGDLLNADFTGGTAVIKLSGHASHKTADESHATAVIAGVYAHVTLQQFARSSPFQSPIPPETHCYIGKEGGKGTGAENVEELIPITFKDSKFNGGAVTNAELDVEADYGETISLNRLVFDDAVPKSALAGVVAGGTNTILGTTVEGFYARTKNDFNGDGYPDLVFQNTATGKVVLWFLEGTKYLSAEAIGTVADPNWEIVGTGSLGWSGKTIRPGKS